MIPSRVKTVPICRPVPCKRMQSGVRPADLWRLIQAGARKPVLLAPRSSSLLVLPDLTPPRRSLG